MNADPHVYFAYKCKQYLSGNLFNICSVPLARVFGQAKHCKCASDKQLAKMQNEF